MFEKTVNLALSEAAETFAERLAIVEARARASRLSCRAMRKGKTLYTLSAEAREMRRIDRVYNEARYAI